jgi:hypothetical protein
VDRAAIHDQPIGAGIEEIDGVPEVNGTDRARILDRSGVTVPA